MMPSYSIPGWWIITGWQTKLLSCETSFLAQQTSSHVASRTADTESSVSLQVSECEDVETVELLSVHLKKHLVPQITVDRAPDTILLLKCFGLWMNSLMQVNRKEGPLAGAIHTGSLARRIEMEGGASRKLRPGWPHPHQHIQPYPCNLLASLAQRVPWLALLVLMATQLHAAHLQPRWCHSIRCLATVA